MLTKNKNMIMRALLPSLDGDHETMDRYRRESGVGELTQRTDLLAGE